MNQKYKISNHLTGVLFFGRNDLELEAAQIEYHAGWDYSQGGRPSTGWEPAFNIADEEFYILAENESALFLKNVNTGIKFWIGGWAGATLYLQRIPI